jgi:hypothetical protein
MTASERQQRWQIAECLLPGLTVPVAEELALRITAELASRPSPDVSFLGSLLMPGDDVLLLLFSGPQAGVRAVSEQARLPFERILPCIGLGWPAGSGTGPRRVPLPDG